MTSNERKLEAVKEALEALFSDTSVSVQRAVDNLEELQGDIETKLDSLRGDLRREQAGGK